MQWGNSISEYFWTSLKKSSPRLAHLAVWLLCNWSSEPSKFINSLRRDWMWSPILPKWILNFNTWKSRRPRVGGDLEPTFLVSTSRNQRETNRRGWSIKNFAYLYMNNFMFYNHFIIFFTLWHMCILIFHAYIYLYFMHKYTYVSCLYILIFHAYLLPGGSVTREHFGRECVL